MNDNLTVINLSGALGRQASLARLVYAPAAHTRAAPTVRAVAAAVAVFAALVAVVAAIVEVVSAIAEAVAEIVAVVAATVAGAGRLMARLSLFVQTQNSRNRLGETLKIEAQYLNIQGVTRSSHLPKLIKNPSKTPKNLSIFRKNPRFSLRFFAKLCKTLRNFAEIAPSPDRP